MPQRENPLHSVEFTRSHIVELAGARKVVCFGQLSVDTAILLDQPVQIGDQTHGHFSKHPGGSAAITAHNAAILGADVALAGFCGEGADDDGALRELAAAGVDVSGVQPGASLRVTVLVEPDGERTMISNNATAAWDRVTTSTRPGDIAYFEGWPLFDPAARDRYTQLIRAVSASGATVALDVCSASRGQPSDHLELLTALPLDLLFANEAEAEHYQLLDADLDAILVVHRGGDPTILCSNGNTVEVGHQPITPTDTTGAGDSFAAGFVAAVASGAALLEAVGAGHEAARRVLNIPGPLLPAQPARRPISTRTSAA